MRSVTGKPWYILLLPVFFFLHAYKVNFAPGLAGAVLGGIVKYSLIGLALATLFFLLLRHWQKAALPAFFLLAFNFFFGSIQDLLKQQLPAGSFFLRYSFFIPLVLLALVALLLYLKRSKQPFEKVTYFLNLLFSLFIAIELAGLLPLLFSKGNKDPGIARSLIPCDTCSKPDVYVIITDEYAGRRELQDIFSFDNSAFERELEKRGFLVTGNSHSNYNGTVFSIASLLNMQYLPLRGKGMVTQADMLLCRDLIRNSQVGQFFKKQGYDFHNCSFFDVQGKKRPLVNHYFYAKSRILAFETFTNRCWMETGFNFFNREKITAVEMNDFNNDEAADRLTRQAAQEKSTTPKFVYTHFARPHHPYYVDRNGRPMPYNDSLKGFERIKKEYTEHLLYTNQRLVQLLDHILQHSARPPVILLASDHGFRQLEEKTAQQYYFMNLCAIHLPNRQYGNIPDSLSIVNTFRVMLNAQFGQRLPLLQDSTIFLTEKALW